MESQEVIADRILEALLPGSRASSNSNITVHHDGRGTWIAVTACLVMLATNIFMALLVLDHSRKIDDLGDYLNAIYMMAPQLKPPEKAD